jgi:hypothetical protein
MAGVGKTEINELVSEMIRNTQVKEVQLEELKIEITRAFTRKGFVPPSW